MSDRTTRSKADAKAKAAASGSDQVAALEAKLAALESKVAQQAALIASLQSKPASGSNEELLAELRKYFASAPSTKVPTYWPKL